jgi:glucose/arabinose dehydrogenase
MPARRPQMVLRLPIMLAATTLLLTAAPTPAQAAVGLTEVGSGFSAPLYVTHAGDSRLFVVEQRGLIKILGGGVFLDLRKQVSQSGSERGLLGLAFHPNYASNRLFYVNYTRQSDGATVVSEYRRSASNPNKADPPSAYKRRVLLVSQPYANHNGGWIGFKPGSRQLYIALGDGGSGGDPGNRAQSKSTLLGKILRINPLDPDGSGPKTYRIPKSNPFVGKTGRDEIWAFGLRNPWRCSFDRVTLKLWCADVGQGTYEEVNRVKTGKGTNFGWRLLEGKHHYNYPGRTSGTLCTSSCKTLPIATYAHSAFGGGNCSVTGGYVARRSGVTHYGKYIFGDYCSGKVWVISADHTRSMSLPSPTATGRQISSFGESRSGRIYLTDLTNGKVYRVNGT